MPRGGSRPGAGRKKGGQSKKTKARRKVVEQAAAKGKQPIDIMLEVMRKRYKKKDYDGAFDAACQCAPYCTPRLAAVTHRGDEAKPIHLVEKLVIIDGDVDASAPSPSQASDVPAQ